jgi:hypothetical protein
MVLYALACASPGLGPSRELTGDAMLASLPADTTLVVGADVEAARDLPAWAEVPGADAFGPVARVRAGCFDEGCVALVEGDFADLTPDALGALVPGAVPRRRGVDLATEAGPLVLRRLSPGKGVAGDRAAVARVATERELGEPGLDVARFAGLVPAGQAFAAAVGTDAIEMLAERVGATLPAVGIDALGVALDLDTRLVRVRARGPDAAAWAAVARARFDDVVVVGDVVELTLDEESLR